MTIKETLERILAALENRLPDDRLWSYDELAVFFGVRTSTLHKITNQPGFPPAVETHPGAKPRFIPAEVKRFAERSRA